jgi:putative sporulation protein YyaC
MHRKKGIYYEDPHAISRIQGCVLEYAELIRQERSLDKFDDIVILCIGTDRLPGDSLGPLIGALLSEKADINAHIYGTMSSPLHANNMEDILHEIDSKFDPHTTLKIAIDAGLSNTHNIGNINIWKGELQPGSGADKDLPSVGDISITGIVDRSGDSNLTTLRNTRMSLIWSMSRVISESLYNINEIRRDTIAETC